MNTKIFEYTNKKVTVIFYADKVSKYYLNSIGDVKQLSIDNVMQECHNLSIAGKKGLFEFEFTAINGDRVNQLTKRDNNWINKQKGCDKHNSIFTMLANKGY